MPTRKNSGQKGAATRVSTRAQKRKKANEDTSTTNANKEATDIELLGSTSDEDSTNNDSEVMDSNSDEETVLGGSARRTLKPTLTRCTLKLQVVGGSDTFGRTLSLIKEFLTQLQTFDKWAYIAPWYENVADRITDVNSPEDIPNDPNVLTSYFPRFMNKKAKQTKHDEYVSIRIGHIINLEELAIDLGTWLRKGSHALYIDMLQAERKREAGFFTNSYFTMDLQALREVIEETIGCKIGLRWKPIAGTFVQGGDPVRAIHIEVDALYYHQGLRKLSEVFGKGITGFKDGRKMRFFASIKNSKSATTRAAIKKAIERQRFFESTVQRDYFNDIMHLDVIPKNSTLPTMRTMITKIRSIQFPHLQLIHSVDETWTKAQFRGDYTYLVMPHLEEEAELMMQNLLPYMRHVYGDEVLPYFTSSVIAIAKDDKWDPVENRVICSIDTNAEMEEEDDFLGFKEAKEFIKEKEATSTKASEAPTRPALNTAQRNLELQQAAADKVNAMTNAAEAAYYKDDDSISTLGSIGTASPNRGTTATHQRETQGRNPSNTSTNIEMNNTNIQDSQSVASSITMESFATLQRQVNLQDNKLSHIDQLLGRMAEVVLKGDKNSQSNSSTKDDDAGGRNSSGEGL